MTKVGTDKISVKTGFFLSLCFGLFLWSYIGLAEPAKYAAPSIESWVLVEGLASGIQFTVFGIALGFIHSKLKP